MQLNIKRKWMKFFAGTECIGEMSCLIKLCEYVFAILAHNMIRLYYLMSIQWYDERNKMSVERNEAILICHYNFKLLVPNFIFI